MTCVHCKGMGRLRYVVETVLRASVACSQCRGLPEPERVVVAPRELTGERQAFYLRREKLKPYKR